VYRIFILFCLTSHSFAERSVAITAENIITKKFLFITFRKKVFMVHFKVLCQHLPEVIELRSASNGMHSLDVLNYKLAAR